MRKIALLSPHRSPRIHGQAAVKLIVAHTPEGHYTAMRQYIAHPGRECFAGERKVSYHVLIKEDGTELTQFVPWDEKAWHAGAMNSSSEGIALAGFARDFELVIGGDKRVVGWDFNQDGEQALAKVIAQRLVARGLPPVWTTDTRRGGFCRHADLQNDRSDPTSDVDEWRVFVAMVQAEHQALTRPRKQPWPIPVPAWFWVWARWKLGVREFKNCGPSFGPSRPKSAPPPGPAWAPGGKHHWAWVRLRALVAAQKA